MVLETAIAISKETHNDIFVAAVTWFRDRPPNFPKRGLTLPYMKKHLPSVVIVKGSDIQKTINTACNRTVEKLLIKRLIIPQNPPQVSLLIRPSLKRHHYVLPSQIVRTHWLLNAAKHALNDWLKGTR